MSNNNFYGNFPIIRRGRRFFTNHLCESLENKNDQFVQTFVRNNIQDGQFEFCVLLTIAQTMGFFEDFICLKF